MEKEENHAVLNSYRLAFMLAMGFGVLAVAVLSFTVSCAVFLQFEGLFVLLSCWFFFPKSAFSPALQTKERMKIAFKVQIDLKH